MATRSSAYRDGVISVLVLAVVAVGWVWWSTRHPADEQTAGPTTTATRTSARPTTTATKQPSTAKPSTTSRPTTSRPTTAKPTSTRTFTPVKAGSYAVRWVSDGDTFSIKDAQGKELASVRIIGPNAPEVTHGASRAECYGRQAQARLRSLLVGKKGTLVDDTGPPYSTATSDGWPTWRSAARAVATLMVRDGYAVELHLPSAGPSVRTPTYEKA